MTHRRCERARATQVADRAPESRPRKTCWAEAGNSSTATLFGHSPATNYFFRRPGSFLFPFFIFSFLGTQGTKGTQRTQGTRSLFSYMANTYYCFSLFSFLLDSKENMSPASPLYKKPVICGMKVGDKAKRLRVPRLSPCPTRKKN